MQPLRVLVVSDDPFARAGLAALLGEEGLAVVGRAADADVAVWDWAGEADWQGLGVPVLALLRDETQARAALAAGARGVLLRRAETEALGAAARAVALGLAVLEPELLAGLLPEHADSEEAGASEVEPLTAREAEVLRLLAAGLSNKAIARELGISDHTAKFHVAQILAKLGAQGRTEAVVRAAQLGLVLL